jgi:hypothetical protein
VATQIERVPILKATARASCDGEQRRGRGGTRAEGRIELTGSTTRDLAEPDRMVSDSIRSTVARGRAAADHPRRSLDLGLESFVKTPAARGAS